MMNGYKLVPENIYGALQRTRPRENVAVGMVRDPEKVWKIIFKDKAYSFLKTVCGSPPYMVRDPEKVRKIIFKDKAYSFLKTVCGSPPYWQMVMYRLLAAEKQLGLLTWFLTLSAADSGQTLCRQLLSSKKFISWWGCCGVLGRWVLLVSFKPRDGCQAFSPYVEMPVLECYPEWL